MRGWSVDEKVEEVVRIFLDEVLRGFFLQGVLLFGCYIPGRKISIFYS